MQSSPMFIGISIGIIAFLLLIFRWGRFSGIKTETRLYLQKKPYDSTVQKNPTEVVRMDPATASARPEEARSKNLNVLFMYNGHSWDAYEILGLPAGASLPMVEEAYKRMSQQISADSREFLKTAYQAAVMELRAQQNMSKRP